MVFANDCDNNTPIVVVFLLFMFVIVLDIFTLERKSRRQTLMAPLRHQPESSGEAQVLVVVLV